METNKRKRTKNHFIFIYTISWSNEKTGPSAYFLLLIWYSKIPGHILLQANYSSVYFNLSNDHQYSQQLTYNQSNFQGVRTHKKQQNYHWALQWWCTTLEGTVVTTDNIHKTSVYLVLPQVPAGQLRIKECDTYQITANICVTYWDFTSNFRYKLWQLVNEFYVLLTVHLGIIFVNNQLISQFFFI
jgi:hypothetical protein